MKGQAEMDPAIISKFIDHTDPDVIGLATAAITAIPDAETPLLILADRLAETGDEVIERRARKLAKHLNQPPRSITGFGERSAEIVFEYLGADDAMMAGWLAMRWTLPAVPTDAGKRSICLAMLSTLGLNRAPAAAAAYVLQTLDPFEDEDWVRYRTRSQPKLQTEARNDLRNAAMCLLSASIEFSDLDTVQRWVWRAISHAMNASRLVTRSPNFGAMRFRHDLAGIVEQVTEQSIEKVLHLARMKRWFPRQHTEPL